MQAIEQNVPVVLFITFISTSLCSDDNKQYHRKVHVGTVQKLSFEWSQKLGSKNKIMSKEPSCTTYKALHGKVLLHIALI